uniref:Uncharacterized protein n=1 Tax=Globisporangium ultimum (strain ATCC 200006 / CBS 805.95 / DAOM BR144) TaxID=431595 RepID=K3XB42_GLOUD
SRSSTWPVWALTKATECAFCRQRRRSFDPKPLRVEPGPTESLCKGSHVSPIEQRHEKNRAVFKTLRQKHEEKM